MTVPAWAQKHPGDIGIITINVNTDRDIGHFHTRDYAEWEEYLVTRYFMPRLDPERHYYTSRFWAHNESNLILMARLRWD
jgi:hypothetical protein